MKKKILSAIMIIAMMMSMTVMVNAFSATTVEVNAYETIKTSGMYKYFVTTLGNAVITEINGNPQGEYTLPSTLDGYPVIAVCNHCLEDLYGVTSLIIPDSYLDLCIFGDEEWMKKEGIEYMQGRSYTSLPPNIEYLVIGKHLRTMRAIAEYAGQYATLDEMDTKKYFTKLKWIAIHPENENFYTENGVFYEKNVNSNTGYVKMLVYDSIVIYDFTVDKNSGVVTTNGEDGDKFTFTAITSQNVDEISLWGNEQDGEWYEISYEDLDDIYGVDCYNEGNRRIWTCTLPIYEEGERTIRLCVDGICHDGSCSGKEVKLYIDANEVKEEADYEDPYVYNFYTNSSTTINRDEVERITFFAAASDNVGVKKLVLSNGVPIDTEYDNVAQFRILTSGLSLGENEFFIIAYDDAGNYAYSDSIYIYVTENMPEKPIQRQTSKGGPIGAIIGYAMTTDIKATINGYDIPSFNVNGYTYIVAEDLAYYGFNVTYDNSMRTLSVKRNNSVKWVSKSYSKPYVYSYQVGQPEHNLLYTDIETFLNGDYTASYNINGQTIICFNDLAKYGEIRYNNNSREISLKLEGLNSRY